MKILTNGALTIFHSFLIYQIVKCMTAADKKKCLRKLYMLKLNKATVNRCQTICDCVWKTRVLLARLNEFELRAKYVEILNQG